jgi:hypothetical protein
MMTLIIGIGIGLVVGWWLLPQPQFMKDLYVRFFGGGSANG